MSVGWRGKRDGFQEKVYRWNCERKWYPLLTRQAVMQAVTTIDRGGLTEMEKADVLQWVMDKQMSFFGVGQNGGLG